MIVIDEKIFEAWTHKTIKQALRLYADSLNIDDLRQDAYVAAYICLRRCQTKNIAIDYNIVIKRINQALSRAESSYKSRGITYAGVIDIIMEDDVESVAS